MRTTNRHPARQRAGFTLSEVLITIAIITILLAVAIPSVISLRGRLKMMELDDTAREIFLAAQNTLTARQAAGTLDTPEGEQVNGLYWLDSDAPDYLLPTGAIEGVAAGNHYEVLYNAKTATVLEVYYAESSLPVDLHDGKYSNDDEGGPALRRAEKIGYYNGEDLERNDVEQIPPLDGDFLVNTENLYIHLIVPNATEYAAGVKLTIILEELDRDGNVVPGRSHTFPDKTYSTAYDSGTGEFVLTLDSLNGPHFKDICPEITPGADIRATARLEKPGDSKWIPVERTDEDNSLFAERPLEEREMAYIAYPRHLQNLEPSFSGVKAITDAIQIADIDWPADHDFISINNAELNSYDGQKKAIKNLRGSNGLFKRFESGRLSNIYIADPHINEGDGDTKNEYGVLAGTVVSTKIDDCRVYAATLPYSASITSPAGFIGGLVGKADASVISNSFAALPLLAGDSSTLGGLIAVAKDCKVYNSYAVIDQMTNLTNGFPHASMFIGQMSGSNEIKNCYAVGNIAVGGDICGFSSGNAKISDSYCAVTYDGATGSVIAAFTFGVNIGDLSGCFYLSAGFNDLFATPLSYTDMSGGVNMPGQWTPIDATQSHPYRPELSGKRYPFPALKDSSGPLPHYGSWPVQTVDAIKAFRADRGDEEVDYLICPLGGSISFWAEPQSGNHSVDVRVDKVSVSFYPDDKATGVDARLISDESGGSRTQITLQGNQPGVYAVEVSADGTKLWVPVIVCSAEMKLTGKAGGLEVPNSANLLDGQTNSAVLSLPTGESAQFTATMAVTGLDAETAAAGMEALYAAANAPVSTGSSPLTISADNWLGFRVVQNGEMVGFGPGVTLNEKVADGVYHLRPDGTGNPLYHVKNPGTIADTAKNATSDTLTVTGQSAGTATVSVCWAMDSRLTVNGHIEVAGTRAFIYSATANANNATGRTLGYKDNYPYHLAIKPAPKEAVTLTFTGKLFGTAPSNMNQAWDWIITDENGTEVGRTSQELAPGIPPPDAFTVELKNYAPHARYKVQMIYKYGDDLNNPTYVTSDFMYLDVTRTTVNKETENNIDLTLKDDIVLEQINWGEQVARPAGVTGDLNKATISGHVDGAADSRLLWYLGTDENKKQITGPMTVLDNGVPIATLDWTMLSSGDSGVIIEALDSDYYGDTPLTFTLLAAAQDNDDAPETKAVQVSIMPKLDITPKSKVTKVGTAVVYSANRSTTAEMQFTWDYLWTYENKTTVSGQSTTSTIELKASNPGICEIKAQYGPYIATATLEQIKGWLDISGIINWDGFSDRTSRNYFLLEKNAEKELELSFFPNTIFEVYIATERFSPATGIADFGSVLPGSTGLGRNNTTHEGSRRWSVSGIKFGSVEMYWKFNHEYLLFISSDVTYDLYVVGTEFTRNGQPITDELVITGQTGTAQVDLSGYFPAAVGTGTLTVTSDRPQVASFKTATEGGAAQLADSLSFSPGETGIDQTITLQAHKYGTTLITATYKIGDREYSDTFSLRVEPPEGALHVKLEVCGESDRYDLEKLFGKPNEHLAAYADYGDAQTPNFIPTLLSEPAFGMDTLYLKACLTDGSKILDPAGYIHEIVATVDNARVAAIETPKDADGKPMLLNDTLYIKLTSHNGALSGDDVTVTAHFGTLSGKQPVRVYSEPSVVIRDASGAVVTNGHTVIDGFDPDPETGKMTYRFRAELYPRLVSAPGVDAEPLDGLAWFPEFPSVNYQADAFLTLKPDGDGRVVEIHASPGCKVAINVQSNLAYDAKSELSKSAHALVFIPKKNP